MIKLNKLAITAKSAAFLDAINMPIKNTYTTNYTPSISA